MGDILQPTHLLFVLVVALLVLGPKRLPEVGRALGGGLRDFRSAVSGEERPESAIPPPSDPAPTPFAVQEPTDMGVPAASPEPADATEPGSSQPQGDTESPTEAREPAEAVTSATISGPSS